MNRDAFSSGQIGSKIWLCEELENLFDKIDTIWIYGGWYGIAAFLLRARNNIQINKIRSIDIDPACEPKADVINENWKWQDWQFKAVTADCNSIIPTNVDLIINTSTEHFEDLTWWTNIPKGTMVALQGNNMPHEDHHTNTKNLNDFISLFPLSEIFYSGQKEFIYPSWGFTRFMLIGTK